MSIQSKLLLIFVALVVLPALLAGAFNYASGVRTVERSLRTHAESDAARMAREAEALIAGHEKDLSTLAESMALRRFINSAEALSADGAQASPPAAAGDADELARASVAGEAQATLRAFIVSDARHFASVTCLDSKGNPVLRAEIVRDAQDARHCRFQMEDFVTGSVNFDGRVWQSNRGDKFRSPVMQEPDGIVLRFTVPVAGGEQSARHSGALVAVLKLEELFEKSAGRDASIIPASTTDTAASSRVTLALDNETGRIISHTNDALKYRPIAEAAPSLTPLADKMTAGISGSGYFDTPDEGSWLVAYRQLRGTSVSVAVGENYTAATNEVRRAGLFHFGLLMPAGTAAVFLLLLVARRAAARIERVAAGAAAIAGGNLNQHIDVQANDETKTLVASFNLMSDRLRELIAHEAESKQFESFVRLSAMLTHDLKNAITGLSMLVSNMEKMFHREEFRADAVWSLREATDKLRRIVSRLNEPVKSLSGEYRRDARPTDLVSVIKRVIAVNVEPVAPLYDIETRLPETLVATVEAGRIENVVENLIINALEAMGAGGGRLSVEAGTVEDGRIFFSIADTGPGMSEEFIKTRLFHPFATTKERGIGLGLFTCREIVEAHGGRLEVDSRPGAGTRFRVVLPSALFTSRDSSRQMQEGKLAVEQDGPGA